MNNGILYISCGLPGSGKSTFLNDVKSNDEVIVSRDDIRFSLLKPGEPYFSHEHQVFNVFTDTIIKNIKAGKNVYADATHLNSSSRNKLIYGLFNKGCHPSKIVAIYFDIPLATCIERDKLRSGTNRYVGSTIIENMARNTYKPNLEFERNICELFIVDADGDISKEE